MPYSPPSAAQPFTLAVSDKDLSEWRQLLQLSKLGPKTYENQQTAENYGVTYEWLKDAKDYWLNQFDWRAQEKHINSFPNYKIQVDDLEVHFIGLFSQQENAIPILFMHGWPGSFTEFLPICDLIRKQYSPEDLPYHIIVPSLPGYTLSSGGPQDRDWTMIDTAAVMENFMQKLGFAKYLVQGGDVGSFVGRVMASLYDSVVGIHLNMFTTPESPNPDTLDEAGKKSLARAQTFRATGMAYTQEHATRPSTIGHVVSSNPLAMLAWIGEKFIEWSDETPSFDDILTNISLYWFTDGFPRSIYPYRTAPSSGRLPLGYIQKPTGFSFFPQELAPGIKSALEKHSNLITYRQHARGGHFAALEQPKELWEDVEEFVAKAWKN